MDDALERIKKRGTIDEFRARLVKEIHALRDAIDERQRLLDAIEGGERQAPKKYEVIQDVLPLVLNSEQPIAQSAIFQQLKSKIMAELGYDQEDAEANLSRSLNFHTTEKLTRGWKDHYGIRAVSKQGGKYVVVPFKTKNNPRGPYPDNLIWHVSKIP